MYSRTASGTNPRRDSPDRTRARISVDETSTRRTGTTRGAFFGGSSPRVSTTTVASRMISSGARQRGNDRQASAPSRKNRSTWGASSAKAFNVSTVKDNPSRSISIEETARRGSSPMRRRVMASRAAPGAVVMPALSGCRPVGTNTRRSSARASYASIATSKWPRWGGSNVPPKIPRRTPRGLRFGAALRAGGGDAAPLRDFAVSRIGGPQLRADVVRIVAIADRAIGIDELELRATGGRRRRVVLHDVFEIDDGRVVRAALVVMHAVLEVLLREPFVEMRDLSVGIGRHRRAGIQREQLLVRRERRLAVRGIEVRTVPHLLIAAAGVIQRAIGQRIIGERLGETRITLGREQILGPMLMRLAQVVVRPRQQRIVRRKLERQLFEARDGIVPIVFLEGLERARVQLLVRALELGHVQMSRAANGKGERGGKSERTAHLTHAS